MRRLLWLSLVANLAGLPCIHAQLKGRVVEISETDTLAVPGAILYWMGDKASSVTNDQGLFSIPLSPTSRVLHINSVGYAERQVQISDTAHFALIVLRSSSALKEVEVVYYSSGTEISYLNPIKVETLNERSLMKAACCNLSESFETNPSIDVAFTDAVSGAKQIQMLGLAGQYAQITRENMPYMRGLASSYGLTFIPGTWIRSIQLSKGAGSVVNGYESFTGQVNTELQDPRIADKVNFNAYVNNNARNEYNLNLAHKFDPNQATAVLGHISFNPLLQDMNGDGFADIPSGRQYNVYMKHVMEFPKTGWESQIGGSFMDDDRTGGQVPGMHDMSTMDSLPPYHIGIRNKKYEVFNKTGYVFKNKPGTTTGLQLSYLDHSQDNFFGLNTYTSNQRSFYANYIFQGIFGTTAHGYKTGLSYLHDDVRESFNSRRYTRVESVPGAFFEYSYNQGEHFNLVAGIRGDYHNYYGFFATPRLHLRYAFTPDAILRVSGGRALRTANIFADNSQAMASSRTWIIEGSAPGNPYGLNPETGWNYGLNFTQRFKINYRDAHLTIDAYRSQFTSQVIADYDQSPQAVHIYNLQGQSWSNTAQIEFAMEPRKRMQVKTAYRFVDAQVQYKQGLMQRPLISRHRAFINGMYETRDRHWQFDATLQYHGAKRLPNTDSNPEPYKRARFSPGYFNMIAQVVWVTKFGQNDFQVYLGGEDLLNYKQTDPIVAAHEPFGPYFDASMVWGPIYGRMVYAGLRLKIK